MLYMLTGAITMSIMCAAVKMLGQHTNGAATVWQTSMIGSVGRTSISYGICQYKKVDAWWIPKDKLKVHIARTLLGPSATTCQFIAVYLIPLSLSVTIMFT